MQKSDFKKGQIVFLKIIEGSNAYRRMPAEKHNDIELLIIKTTVTSVGSKYIIVNDTDNKWTENKFEIDNNFNHWVPAGSMDYKLFLSKQDAYDSIESENLYREIKNAFDSWKNNRGYNLDQLRAIKNILNQTSIC